MLADDSVYKSTVTSKGQVTIPKAIRDVIGVTKGGKIIFRKRYDGIVVMENTNPVNELSGRLKQYSNTKNPVDIDAIKEKLADERAKELGY